MNWMRKGKLVGDAGNFVRKKETGQKRNVRFGSSDARHVVGAAVQLETRVPF